MITVIWEFEVGDRMSPAEIDAAVAAAAPLYRGVPGLVRKTFGVSEDGRSVVGVYLWRSIEDAEALYTPDWIAAAEARWRVRGRRRDWRAAAVVENRPGAASP
jgi:hypothetical protein